MIQIRVVVEEYIPPPLEYFLHCSIAHIAVDAVVYVLEMPVVPEAWRRVSSWWPFSLTYEDYICDYICGARSCSLLERYLRPTTP
jgi:hypothetical protein